MEIKVLLFCCGWESFGQSFVFLRYCRSVFNFPKMCLPRVPRSFLRPLPLSACYAGYRGFFLGKGFFVKNPVDRVASSSALLTSMYHRGWREGKEKWGAHEGESRGTFSLRVPCVLACASLFLSHFPLKRLMYIFYTSVK